MFLAVSISIETVNNSDGSNKLKLINSKYALNNGLVVLYIFEYQGMSMSSKNCLNFSLTKNYMYFRFY